MSADHHSVRFLLVSFSLLMLLPFCLIQVDCSGRTQRQPSTTDRDSNPTEATTVTTTGSRRLKIAVVENEQYFIRASAARSPATGAPPAAAAAAVSLERVDRRNATGGSGISSGYFVDVVDRISRQIQLTVDWSVERTAGKRRRDGSWTGLTGKIVSGEVDAGLVAVTAQHQSDRRLTATRSPLLVTTLTLLVGTRLAARLHVRGPNPALTVDDLLNGTLTPGVVADSRVAQLFQRSDNPVYRQLWQRINSTTVQRQRSLPGAFQLDVEDWSSTSNVVTTIDEGAHRVFRDDNFVLVVESTEAALTTRRPEFCTLTVVDQAVPVAEYHLVTSLSTTSSRLRDDIWAQLDETTTRLRETGMLGELYEKWWGSNVDGCWSNPAAAGPDGYRSAHVEAPGGEERIDSDWERMPPAEDWQSAAMERIFYESPLKRRSTSTTTTTTSGSVVVTSSVTAAEPSGIDVGSSVSTAAAADDVELFGINREHAASPAELAADVDERNDALRVPTLETDDLEQLHNDSFPATTSTTVALAAWTTSELSTREPRATDVQSAETTGRRQDRRRGRTTRRPQSRRGHRHTTTSTSLVDYSSSLLTVSPTSGSGDKRQSFDVEGTTASGLARTTSDGDLRDSLRTPTSSTSSASKSSAPQRSRHLPDDALISVYLVTHGPLERQHIDPAEADDDGDNDDAAEFYRGDADLEDLDSADLHYHGDIATEQEMAVKELLQGDVRNRKTLTGRRSDSMQQDSGSTVDVTTSTPTSGVAGLTANRYWTTTVPLFLYLTRFAGLIARYPVN